MYVLHAAAKSRLPRASGDGPMMAAPGSSVFKAAPRERGWTPACVLGKSYGCGCPARAGMDPYVTFVALPVEGLPRASGDGPIEISTVAEDVRAAPRERGWTLAATLGGAAIDGCPARAGMDPGPHG